MDVLAIEPVSYTRLRCTRRQSVDVSYHGADHENAEDIRLRSTTRHRGVHSARPAASSSMTTATGRPLSHDFVSVSLPVEADPLQNAQKKVVLSNSFRSVCRRAPGFDWSHMSQRDPRNVHQLLDAAHIPPAHRTYVFLTFEELYCLRQLVWLRATFMESRAHDVTTTQTTSES